MNVRKLMRRIAARSVAGTVATALALAAGDVMAQSPTVTISFTGYYNSVSCTVQGGNLNVTLPTISTTALSSAGATAGATEFNIPVLCESDVNSLVAYFQQGPTTDADGNLNVENPTDPKSATRVQIQLTNGDGSPIRVGDVSTVKPVSVKGSAVTSIPFFARYYATGQASAGTVNTYVTFVLEML
jgi:major type 1 subunit fimbrin (pilin)